jgi:pimeloyl-ACP methyl ester carboxylesterase
MLAARTHADCPFCLNLKEHENLAMKIKPNRSLHLMPVVFQIRLIMPAICLVLAGCASQTGWPNRGRVAAAEQSLREARSTRMPVEQRAANYLRAAEISAPLINYGAQPTPSRKIYDEAASELTVLLRSTNSGSFWNRPLTLATGTNTYRLRFQPASNRGVWAPDYFTAFKLARDVNESGVKTPDKRAGIGGMLVGVRRLDPREEFAPKVGIHAAVTATLDFHGHDATLSLDDPTKKTTTRVAGTVHPLAADFSAPNCDYPHIDQLLFGLSEALRPGKYTSDQGIFLLQPFDPQRIPVIFVHGLISTPYIWLDPINQINQDPVLRARYQPLVFAYPSGYPLAYTALIFREQLAKLEERYPMPHGFLLVGHSEGGLVSQMQTTNLTRADWHRAVGSKIDGLFARQSPNNEMDRALLITANPRVKRVIFIATPHRGSELAINTPGDLANMLIRFPLSKATQLKEALGNSLEYWSGNKNLLPTSVTSFSPKNPTLITMATKQVVPPCHSIIGNRGRPGPLAQSSDGVVPYWSSHLDYAKSEVIVPGPHGCYDYPESINEMKRILHLHLQTIGE